MISYIHPYCISAYIIHEKASVSKYLLLRRCGKYLTDTWQMVSGGTHPGETAWQAALREIIEETNLQPVKLYCADAVETIYTQTMDKILFVPVFVAFVDTVELLQLSPKEHDAYEWLSFEMAKERLVWSEQKRIITHIHENFVLRKPNDLLVINTKI